MKPNFTSRARNLFDAFGAVDASRWVLLGLSMRIYHPLLRAIAPKDRFDELHNVDTEGVGVPADVRLASSEAQHLGAEYWPTPRGPVRHILRSLAVDLSQYVFVDYGAGKGRVVLTAMEFPFKRIVGVEWSESLVQVARRNVASFRGLERRCGSIEFVVADAQCYEPLVEPSVFFLSNPFGQKDPTVLRRVLQNIDERYSGSGVGYILVFLDIHKPGYDVVAILRELLTCKQLDVFDSLHPNFAWAVVRNTPSTRHPSVASAIQ